MRKTALLVGDRGRLIATPALAQDEGTLDPNPLPPLADPADPKLPAKEVFGRVMTPLEAQARSIGFYSRGCLAGAKALPVEAIVGARSPIAQPHVGQPGDDRLPRAVLAEGRRRRASGTAFWSATSPSRGAARC